MKYLITLFLLITFYSNAQIKATVKLADGTTETTLSGNDVRHDYTHSAFKGFKIEFLDFTFDERIIDDSDQSIEYYGDWATGSCNCTWSQSANDSMVFRFTDATRIEWHGELMSHHGIVDIYFDNEYDVTMDTYSPENVSPAMNWYRDDLDPEKIYTFKLVATGKKNISSSGDYIVNQFIKIIHDPVVEPPPIIIPPPDIKVSIIQKGYYEVLMNGVQDGPGYTSFDKAIEHAINLGLQYPSLEITIKAPYWEVKTE